MTTDKLPTVLICIPNAGMVHTDYMLSLIGLHSYSRGFAKVAIADNKSSYIDMNRNMLAGNAVAHRYDMVLFTDTDMSFPKNSLERLIKAERAVVGVAYKSRHQELIVGATLDGMPLEEDGLREMDYLGGGLLLVRTSVFAAMGAPWFYNEYLPGSTMPVGENVVFCRNVRKEGLEIWCDQTLSREVLHIGTKAFSLKDRG